MNPQGYIRPPQEKGMKQSEMADQTLKLQLSTLNMTIQGILGTVLTQYNYTETYQTSNKYQFRTYEKVSAKLREKNT